MNADELYAQLLAAGVDVLLDDRDERPGVLLADVELIGVPHRVVIGERGLKEGSIEYQRRNDAAPTPVPISGAAAFIRERLCAPS
jgi:prolyl-tRNA synthetase